MHGTCTPIAADFLAILGKLPPITSAKTLYLPPNTDTISEEATQLPVSAFKKNYSLERLHDMVEQFWDVAVYLRLNVAGRRCNSIDMCFAASSW